MKQPPEYVRLIFEFVVLAALIELALMLALPLILPQQSGWLEAAVDTTALAFLLGAAIWWRLRRHAGGSFGMAASTTSHKQAVTVSLVVLVMCLVLNGLVAYQVFQENKARVNEKFDRLSTRVEADLHRRVKLPLFGLRGAAGAFNASENLSPEEFKQYVNSLDMARTFPGVRGLGYIVPVERSAVPAFTAAHRMTVDAQYTIKSSGVEPNLTHSGRPSAASISTPRPRSAAPLPPNWRSRETQRHTPWTRNPAASCKPCCNPPSHPGCSSSTTSPPTCRRCTRCSPTAFRSSWPPRANRP